MNKRCLPFETSLKSAYEDLHKLFSVEGGAYYFATRKNKYYVLSDFGTLADFFEGYEKELAELKSEYEFSNKDECLNFIKKLIVDTKNEQSNIRLPEALL